MALDVLGKDYTALKTKKLYLFDMDGTIYMENRLFDGVLELLQRIKADGGKYVFITNNSSKSVNDYVKKVCKMELCVDKENFFTSTQAAVMLLNKKHVGALVYAQGTRSFIKELKNSGIKVTEKYSDDTDVVLVGFDNELTSAKLRETCKTLKKDVPYYATNPDWVCPVEFGYVPDCGSMCFGIEKATGKAPYFIGKPRPDMINAVMEKFGADKSDTVVIGDRLYTDIASGVNAGVDTVLVLSGEATMNDYNESEVKSTYVLNSVKDLLSL
ncbi:MAG: HAD-IIA family hydrolase [Clostridiales bacterium]|nr:HAD-IIA family hydrolase [Clostridiales bacterium]